MDARTFPGCRALPVLLLAVMAGSVAADEKTDRVDALFHAWDRPGRIHVITWGPRTLSIRGISERPVSSAADVTVSVPGRFSSVRAGWKLSVHCKIKTTSVRSCLSG